MQFCRDRLHLFPTVPEKRKKIGCRRNHPRVSWRHKPSLEPFYHDQGSMQQYISYHFFQFSLAATPSSGSPPSVSSVATPPSPASTPGWTSSLTGSPQKLFELILKMLNINDNNSNALRRPINLLFGLIYQFSINYYWHHPKNKALKAIF